MENRPEQTPEPPLPKEINEVIGRVKRPIVGFSDKKHPDGRPFSAEEQIEATKKQLEDLARLDLEEGDPIDNIVEKFSKLRIMRLTDEETTP